MDLRRSASKSRRQVCQLEILIRSKNKLLEKKKRQIVALEKELETARETGEQHERVRRALKTTGALKEIVAKMKTTFGPTPKDGKASDRPRGELRNRTRENKPRYDSRVLQCKGEIRKLRKQLQRVMTPGDKENDMSSGGGGTLMIKAENVELRNREKRAMEEVERLRQEVALRDEKLEVVSRGNENVRRELNEEIARLKSREAEIENRAKELEMCRKELETCLSRVEAEQSAKDVRIREETRRIELEARRDRESLEAKCQELDAASRKDRELKMRVLELTDSVQRLLSQVNAHLDGADATSTMRMNRASHESYDDHLHAMPCDDSRTVCGIVAEVHRRTTSLNDRVSSALASSIGSDCAMQ